MDGSRAVQVWALGRWARGRWELLDVMQHLLHPHVCSELRPAVTRHGSRAGTNRTMPGQRRRLEVMRAPGG